MILSPPVHFRDIELRVIGSRDHRRRDWIGLWALGPVHYRQDLRLRLHWIDRNRCDVSLDACRDRLQTTPGRSNVSLRTYQSEIVPSSLRGFVIASLQLFLNSGALIGTGVNRALRLETDGRGWKIVTGIQFVFPTLLCLCAPFVPHSPRWLLSKDRDEDAIASLRRVRTKEDIATGRCEEEIVAIRQALQSHVHKKPWKTLIQGTNLRRTIIVIIIYQYGQTTGQAFSSTYSTTFYKNYGFANQAFLYPVITAALSVLCVLPGMFLVESVG